jgi:biotin carboxyl carrier protein
MRHAFMIGDVERLLWLSRRPESAYELDLGDSRHTVSLNCAGQLVIDGETSAIEIAKDVDRIHIHLDGEAHEVVYRDPVARQAVANSSTAERVLRAPMPGAVVAVPVAGGQTVAAGEALMVIDSMKLETVIRSPRAGVVELIHCLLGQGFERGAPLITLAED